MNNDWRVEPVLNSGVPVVETIQVRLDPDLRGSIRQMAGNLLQRMPGLNVTHPFGQQVMPGLTAKPNLIIEDHSHIRLFEHTGDEAYSYRAMLLAGDADQVIIGVRRSSGFENYCSDYLGLGSPEVLTPAASTHMESLTQRCLKDDAVINVIAGKARQHNGLNVIPYMGTGAVWKLAGEIAERAGVPIRIASPPPGLTRRTNDKLWFARRIEELFGEQALAPAEGAFNLALLAHYIRDMAKQNERVAVKLTDSASSAGNIVLRSSSLSNVSLAAIRHRLNHLLRLAGWRGSYPLMVTAWESPIITSPSVHVWIPTPDEGDPKVEGIFDQSVIGPQSEFNGAAPTALDTAWQYRLAGEAFQISCLFQDLGYVGRCSFDAILVGSSLAGASLHWVECNGRWGGVSIPVTLVNRIFGDWRQRSFVIIEESHLKGSPQKFDSVLEVLSGELFRRNTSPVGAVILSPGRIETGSGYECLVFGVDPADARQRAQRVAGKLVASISASTPLCR